MRLIDADKLETQYRALIEYAKKEMEKIDYINDRQNWNIWAAVIGDRYAFLIDVIRAKTENETGQTGQTFLIDIKFGEFGCASCGWLFRAPIGKIKYCPGCGKLIDRSKTQ